MIKMSARVQVRVPQNLKAQLEEAAANEGVDLPKYLKNHLPDLVKQGMVDVSFAGPRMKPSSVVVAQKDIDPLDDYVMTLKKMAVAKMFQTLAMAPTSPEQQLQYIRSSQQSLNTSPPQQDAFSTKEMMDRLTIWKMLENMEKKTTDPELQKVVADLKNSQEKAMDEMRKNQEKDKKEPDIKELMQWITFYRMAGQPEEAKKYEQLLNTQMSKVTEELHKTQLKIVENQSEWRQKDMQRQIDEIRNAPSQFDQIAQISSLSQKDPAVKAYLHKKLGIEDKGEPLTPEKLGKYIENIPLKKVADIITGIYHTIREQKQTPSEMPAPPILEVPTEGITEEELAEKALPSEVLHSPEPTETPSSSTETTEETEPPQPPPSTPKTVRKPKRRKPSVRKEEETVNE